MPAWRPAVFAAAQGVARALERTSRGLLYVAAGTLTLDGVRAAVTERWQTFGTSETFILSGLMPWEQAFYTRFLKPGDTVLVVGCGTGRDLIALLKAGMRADGLEIAADAVTIARGVLAREKLDATVTVGSIETCVPARSFDAYVFSWLCYSYIPQRAGRVAALRAAASRLRPGGRILISYVAAYRTPRGLPIGITAAIARLTRAGWMPERGDVLWVGSRGLHFEHEFVPGELEDEAHAAGLRVVYTAHTEESVAVLTAD